MRDAEIVRKKRNEQTNDTHTQRALKLPQHIYRVYGLEVGFNAICVFFCVCMWSSIHKVRVGCSQRPRRSLTCLGYAREFHTIISFVVTHILWQCELDTLPRFTTNLEKQYINIYKCNNRVFAIVDSFGIAFFVDVCVCVSADGFCEFIRSLAL